MDYPKMTKVFLAEAADVSTPAFKNWFRNSHVVDDQGQPAIVYHATVSNFDVFRQTRDVGFHFGTQQAAHDRLKHWAGDVDAKNKPANIMPCFLTVQHPLELGDMLNWEPQEIGKELLMRGEISKEQLNKVLIRNSRDDRNKVLMDIIKKLGYDGVSYTNAAEDKGSTTWIAFEAGQVKSVFNRGTWDRRRGSVNE